MIKWFMAIKLKKNIVISLLHHLMEVPLPKEILNQVPIKFELGNKASDSSAVDGINYKFKYELTSCEEDPNF